MCAYVCFLSIYIIVTLIGLLSSFTCVVLADDCPRGWVEIHCETRDVFILCANKLGQLSKQFFFQNPEKWQRSAVICCV